MAQAPQAWVRAALVALTVLAAGRLPAAETVSWVTLDNPPTFIYAGDLADQGAGDQQLRFLFAKLPGYLHQVVHGSPVRIWYEMADRDRICTIGAIRNSEREKVAVFSDRPIVVPGLRFLILENRLEEFRPFLTREGAVDLDALAPDGMMTGGFVSARSHVASIGHFIDNPTRKVQLEKMPEPAQIMNLLHAGRIDFAFVSALEVPYYAEKFRSNLKFLSLPIVGSHSQSEGYIACSNMPVGQAVIARINSVLDDDKQWADFLAPIQRWMDSADFAAALVQKPK